MLESAIFATATTVGFGVVASVSDIATRRIPNRLTAGAMLVALVLRIAATVLGGHGILTFFQGLAWPLGLFVALYIVWVAGLIGAGDVKLAASFSLVLPPDPGQQLIFILGTAAIGGVIAVSYLVIGRLRPAKVQAAHRPMSQLRRMIRVERWRARRHAGIPYAVAISLAATGAALAGIG